MDVSGWTIDQRMRLPDWCFGNRHVIGAYQMNASGASYKYAISEIAFPDPCCIWHVAFAGWHTLDGVGTLRVGLANELPKNEAEMDLADEIFPAFGFPKTGPNGILLSGAAQFLVSFDARKGMVTGGKKLVISLYNSTGAVRANPLFLVSGLPTSMAGWLAHNKV